MFQSTSEQIIKLTPLMIIVVGLLGYNFMSAQWAGPQATAPLANAPAPINTGSTTQAKSGNLMANIVSAATSTWSPRYCDEIGNNCWDPATGAPGSGGALKQHAWGVFNGGVLRYQQAVTSVVPSGTAWVVTLASAPTGDTNYIITGEIASNAQGTFNPISPTVFTVQARSSNLNNFLAPSFTFIVWDPT